MKRIMFIFLALTLAFAVQAQPGALEGTTDFQRTTQPAAIIELPYSEGVVQKAVDDYMSKKGYKGSDNKGFRVFRGYQLRASHDHTSDLYFKIERKSRRDRDVTTIFVVVGKNGEDVKARVNPDNSSIDGAVDLLNDMVAPINAYGLEVQIQDQQDVIKKAQKRFDGLVEDQHDYEKKIKNLQDKLEENRRDQEKQQNEVKKQNDILQVLIGKRKV